MAGLFLAIFLALTQVGWPAYADEAATTPPPPTRDLRVTDAFGQVMIVPAENSKMCAPVDEDVPLQENDVITTGPNSQAELTMDGETVFRLQPDSHFKVLKIFSNNTQLELSQGGLLAKVKPVAREDDAMILKMPTAVVAIRGTEFGAETGDGVSHVGVFDEGHVVVAGAWGREHVKLAPGEETHVPLSNVPQPPRPLTRFAGRRAQMAHVRDRLGYWKAHWEPMGPDQHKQVRDRINSSMRFPSKGFRHSGMKASVTRPAAIQQKPKHVARPHKAVHAAARHPAQRVKHPSAKRNTSSGKSKAKARKAPHPSSQ